MKRSNRNPPADIIGQDLIALHLRELSPSREQAVLQALELDSALRAESATVAATLAAVKDPSMTLSDDLLDRQWQALRPSLLAYPAPGSSLPKWRLPMFAAVALAAACGVWWLTNSRPAPTAPVYHHLVPGPENPNALFPSPPGRHAGEGGKPHDLQRPEQRQRPLMERASLSYQQPAASLSRSAPYTSMTDPGLEPQATSPTPSGADELPLASSVVAPMLPTVSVAQGGKTRKDAPVRARASSSHPIDLTLALGANLTGPRHMSIAGGNGIDTFTASSSPAVSVALHQQFHPNVGYRAALSYTRPDYTYVYKDTLSPYTTSGSVHNGILELAATYVFQGPHSKRVDTAADVGAGLMTFMPLNSSSSSFRYAPAGVLGGSADYALNSKWRVRLSYRAQVFRTQQFEYTGGGDIPVTKDLVVSHEPSIGITYRFGKK